LPEGWFAIKDNKFSNLMTQTVVRKLGAPGELRTHKHLAVVNCTCMGDSVKSTGLEERIKYCPEKVIEYN